MKLKGLKIMLMGIMLMLLGGFMSLIDLSPGSEFLQLLYGLMIGAGMLVGVFGFCTRD